MHRIDNLAKAMAAGATRRQAMRLAGRRVLGTLLASGLIAAEPGGAAARATRPRRIKDDIIGITAGITRSVTGELLQCTALGEWCNCYTTTCCTGSCCEINEQFVCHEGPCDNCI